jgi:hypothetical protein
MGKGRERECIAPGSPEHRHATMEGRDKLPPGLEELWNVAHPDRFLAPLLGTEGRAHRLEVGHNLPVALPARWEPSSFDSGPHVPRESAGENA